MAAEIVPSNKVHGCMFRVRRDSVTLAIPCVPFRVVARLSCWLVFLLLVASGFLATSESRAASQPVCPSNDETPYPSFGNTGESPNVASWHDLVTLPDNCNISLQAPAALAIALAGRFTHAGSVDKIAARLGAISQTQGLKYWSVTDQEWSTLVSEAFALDSSDSDKAPPSAASTDFTGQEMLSGQTLYFAQNDTRSWGLNVYSIRAIESSADHLVFESDNVSAIKLGPITLFQPDDIRSVLFIDRLDDTTWGYYSLAVIRHSSIAAREKSLINRQAAFYRFLTGHAPDQEPPLAP